eukprot:scaffold5212_cov108-Isochrysis_galbana.AAC.9
MRWALRSVHRETWRSPHLRALVFDVIKLILPLHGLLRIVLHPFHLLQTRLFLLDRQRRPLHLVLLGPYQRLDLVHVALGPLREGVDNTLSGCVELRRVAEAWAARRRDGTEGRLLSRRSFLASNTSSCSFRASACAVALSRSGACCRRFSCAACPWDEAPFMPRGRWLSSRRVLPSAGPRWRRSLSGDAVSGALPPPLRYRKEPAAESLAMADMSEKMAQVAAITGLGDDESRALLEAAGGDTAVAVQLHFDQEDSANSAARGAGTSASAAGPSAPALAREPSFEAAGAGMVEERGPLRGVAAPPPAGPLSGFFRLLGFVGNLPGFSHLRMLFLGLGRLIHQSRLTALLLPVAELLLLTPLRLIGLLPSATAQTGAGAVERFAARFEAEHGATHPRFFRGSCSDALSRARREAKFTLVYVHQPRHADTPLVCQQLLRSALFSAFVDQSFVFWVADEATAEGRGVRQALRVRDAPAL